MDKNATAVVLEYLGLMEQRDLEGAQACLAENAEIVFPGDFRPRTTAEIAGYGKKRYAAVSKTYLTREAFPGEHGEHRVLLTGTLQGTTLRGTPFEGIRFVDLFAVKGGKILRQQVWNDLAETGVLDT